MRIAITRNQVPFINGGAESHTNTLCQALRAHGHEADVITLPFRFAPESQVERCMQAWADQDLTQLTGYTPDLVICMQFPCYLAKHPNKITWLIHQHRAVYDLWDTPYVGDWPKQPEAQALRRAIHEADAKYLPECRRLLTISRRVSERLKQFHGLDSLPLHHLPMADTNDILPGPAEDYIFFPSRFESLKRQSLLIRAMSLVRSPVVALFAGDGGQLPAAHALVAELNLSNRVRLMPRIWRREVMSAFYGHALAVCFPPHDEDYGYITVEAMMAAKPVITCTDSGGPLEFVRDGETGLVVAPEPAAIADAIDRLASNRSWARDLGQAGRADLLARDLSWDRVVRTLIGS
ncbi:glycosyl transferase family 1 [Planctomycetota bacterium]|nr:glycosyl transferase family 1 [Planctomycetota bacterium]